MNTVILLKDIVIKAGTVLSVAPSQTERHGEGHFQVDIGLTKDSSGTFTYFVLDDDELKEWFMSEEKYNRKCEHNIPGRICALCNDGG